MPDSKPPSKPATLVFSLLGAGIGIAVTEYTGIVIGLPVAVALILWFVFTKTRLSPKTFQLSIGVLGGQAALFLLIALTGSIGAWKLAVPDLALLIAGIAWLWARPGLPPVIALVFYEAIVLVMNIAILCSAPLGSPPSRALAAHVVIRVSAVACLWAEINRFRKGSNGSPMV